MRIKVSLCTIKLYFYVKPTSTFQEFRVSISNALKSKYNLNIESYRLLSADGYEFFEDCEVGNLMVDEQIVIVEPFINQLVSRNVDIKMFDDVKMSNVKMFDDIKMSNDIKMSDDAKMSNVRMSDDVKMSNVRMSDVEPLSKTLNKTESKTASKTASKTENKTENIEISNKTGVKVPSKTDGSGAKKDMMVGNQFEYDRINKYEKDVLGRKDTRDSPNRHDSNNNKARDGGILNMNKVNAHEGWENVKKPCYNDNFRKPDASSCTTAGDRRNDKALTKQERRLLRRQEIAREMEKSRLKTGNVKEDSVNDPKTCIKDDDNKTVHRKDDIKIARENKPENSIDSDLKPKNGIDSNPKPTNSIDSNLKHANSIDNSKTAANVKKDSGKAIANDKKDSGKAIANTKKDSGKAIANAKKDSSKMTDNKSSNGKTIDSKNNNSKATDNKNNNDDVREIVYKTEYDCENDVNNKVYEVRPEKCIAIVKDCGNTPKDLKSSNSVPKDLKSSNSVPKDLKPSSSVPKDLKGSVPSSSANSQEPSTINATAPQIPNAANSADTKIVHENENESKDDISDYEVAALKNLNGKFVGFKQDQSPAKPKNEKTKPEIFKPLKPRKKEMNPFEFL